MRAAYLMRSPVTQRSNMPVTTPLNTVKGMASRAVSFWSSLAIS